MRARGEHWVWLCAAALGVCLLMIAGLLVVVAVNGLGFFWPQPLTEVTARDGTHILGVETRTEKFRKFASGPTNTVSELTRSQLEVGNRDLYPADFRWLEHEQISGWTKPLSAVTLERQEYGNFHGYLRALKQDGKAVAQGDAAWTLLLQQHPAVRAVTTRFVQIQKQDIGRINTAIQANVLAIRRAERRYPAGPQREVAVAAAQAEIKRLNGTFELLKTRAAALQKESLRWTALMATAEGKEKEIPLAGIVRAYQPNAMGLGAKWAHYAAKVVEFVTGEPRESNTEGGIFPAIFGTVMMTLLMSIAVVPFGVIAALYLREYARQGTMVRLVRIAVNNLAGVPSIVFGVFGLGFFVYFVGGTIDQLFYPDLLPTPTYGTGGILWASLTLALLTVPVVIVATEESIAAVPRGAKEGSLALGASKFQTLCRIVLPASLPGILTGLILAMARGAGEVAPLMITGVVKLAPDLPLDGQFPFLHLDRKFMHLGFHIYDVGFQSPNVEAAKPMVFTTTLLLLLVVVALNLAAIVIRDKIRKKYRTGAFA